MITCVGAEPGDADATNELVTAIGAAATAAAAAPAIASLFRGVNFANMRPAYHAITCLKHRLIDGLTKALGLPTPATDATEGIPT